jgi:hypothetical protein
MNRTILVTLSAWLGLYGLAGGQEIAPAPLAPAPTGVPLFAGPEVMPRSGRDFWAGAEYLLWFSKGMHVPPLVTGNAPGTPVDRVGILDDPSTVVLVGDERFITNIRSGFRLTAGMSVSENCALEGSFFYLGGKDSNRDFTSDGGVILSRPFFDVSTGQFNSELAAFPGAVRGSIGVHADADPVYGAELNLRKCWSFPDPHIIPDYSLCMWYTSKVAVIGGYRYLHMEENVTVTENLTSTLTNDPNTPVGTRFTVLDRFAAENEFNGLQVGGLWEARSGPFTFEIVGKIALGRTQRRVDINGSTVISVPGQAPAAFEGGILALSSNIGSHDDSTFSVVPEVSAKLAYNITDNCRISIGYSFLCWTNVARAGEQIDLNVNPTLFPPPTTVVGPNVPQFTLRESTWWVQGLNFGLEVRF